MRLQDDKKRYPRLSKAPIVSAIAEFRYKSADSVSNHSLKSLKERLKNEYPTHTLIQHMEVVLSDLQDKTSLSVNNTGIDGHVFASSDKKRDVTISNSSFNFKQHGEYSTWEDFKKAVMDTWMMSVDVIKPVTLDRVSIRYINSIEIPFDISSTQPQANFFKTFIAHTGPLHKKPIGQYLLRFTHEHEPSLVVHFYQELKPTNVDRPVLTFIVDIDVLDMEQNIKPTAEAISKKLDVLRDLKNDYFFDNLTKSTFDYLK